VLRRWTAWSEHWQDEVGCVAADSPDGLLFFDPLAPPPELGTPEHTFVTVFFHARDADGRVWAPKPLVRRLKNRGVEVTDPFEIGDELPGGAQCFETAREGEVVYWLPDERALVVGDVLLGAGAKPRPTGEPLRLCPERWLGSKTHDDLRASLQPLLELPVEQVLVSHGAPVLEHATAVLGTVVSCSGPPSSPSSSR
jgi:glyoxylase-like metal-dependent hydrolase (beta-lactamase superfamily II)